MSSLPPPLPPPQEYPAAALQPPPPPLPVQPIAYGTPSATGRPGLLTNIGVLSIVIGVFGIMFNAAMGMTSFGFMIASQASQAIAAAAAATTPSNVAIDDSVMSRAQRRIVIDGLSQVQPLSPARRRQLDAILAEGGDQLIPGAGAGLTAASVRANVSDSGRLPDADGGEGPNYFILGRGRLELFDTHAVFYPVSGGEAVRAQAPEDEEPLDDAADTEPALEADPDADPTAESGLSERQVQAAIQQIQTMLASQGGAQGNKPQLTAAQVKTLKGRFSDPVSGFLAPATDIAGVRRQVNAAIAMPDGSVMIGTQTGNMQIDPSGKVTSSFTFPNPVAGGAGIGFRVNEVAVLLSMVGAAAGVALAIYLIVIGSLVLRQHPKGGRLHAIYAWLKIPLAIGCAIAWVWMFSSFAGSVAGGTNTAPMWRGRMTFAAIAIAVLGCAYPIGLLLALRSQSVRNYYNSTVAGGERAGG